MIDVGLNLASAQFNADVDAVLARAFASGVEAMVLTGTSEPGSRRSLELAERDARLRFTAGVHPHYASQWTRGSAQAFEPLWRAPRCAAVGECGLDYFRDLSPRAVQRTVFEAQLQAALLHGLPAFMHCRDAFDDFVAMVATFCTSGGTGIVHCFTGNTQQALRLQELGLHLGVAGWVTELQRGRPLREAVAFIAPERLHLETDAPYLPPRNRPGCERGRHRNEPAWLEWVAREIAQLRGEPLALLRAQCTANSRALFRLSEPQ